MKQTHEDITTMWRTERWGKKQTSASFEKPTCLWV